MVRHPSLHPSTRRHNPQVTGSASGQCSPSCGTLAAPRGKPVRFCTVPALFCTALPPRAPGPCRRGRAGRPGNNPLFVNNGHVLTSSCNALYVYGYVPFSLIHTYIYVLLLLLLLLLQIEAFFTTVNFVGLASTTW